MNLSGSGCAVLGLGWRKDKGARAKCAKLARHLSLMMGGGGGRWGAGVGYAPDGAGAVVYDDEAAVVGYGYADGAAPDLAVLGDEAGEEVVVLAGGVTVQSGNIDNFIAGAGIAVPGSVLGGEDAAEVRHGKMKIVRWRIYIDSFIDGVSHLDRATM